MNRMLCLMLVGLMLVVAAPAFSAEVTQMWQCEMDDDASEAQVKTGAKAWLDAAKKIEGGANLKAFVYFPIAVNATGEMDVWFVVTAPSAAEWGKFWDNYGGSEAAAQEKKNQEFIVCPDSVLWESIEVK